MSCKALNCRAAVSGSVFAILATAARVGLYVQQLLGFARLYGVYSLGCIMWGVAGERLGFAVCLKLQGDPCFTNRTKG